MHKKINSLKNKKILICVTGSIAAYKTCEIIRILRKQDAIVQVMMSKSAEQFVGKATFAALTNNEVITAIAARNEIYLKSPAPGKSYVICKYSNK